MTPNKILSAMAEGAKLIHDRDALSGEMVFALRRDGIVEPIDDQSVPRQLAASGAVVCIDTCPCGHTEYVLPSNF